MASRRALGTGLPLTMAMFWASTAGATTTRAAAAAILAIREVFISTGLPLGRDTMSRYSFWGGLQGFSLDRQGMNPLGDHMAQGIIHKAVTLDVCQSAEAWAAQMHRKVAPFTGTGMAGVQVAVVGDLDGFERQGLTQGGFDQGCRDATRSGALLCACPHPD